MKTDRWVGVRFESSSSKTPQFMSFVRDFRSDLKAMLKDTVWEVLPFKAGHFYLSGFLRNKETGAYMYWSIFDVRKSFQDFWYTHVLVRTAKSEKDFTGGPNGYTSFKNLPRYLSLKEY